MFFLLKWSSADFSILKSAEGILPTPINTEHSPLRRRQINGKRIQSNTKMSKLNSTSDDQYFFIASQESGLVLEISVGKKGGDLILSKARGTPNQLWRLDENRRLVSRLGLVADIKGKNKRGGTVCHAWTAHDDLNQK